MVLEENKPHWTFVVFKEAKLFNENTEQIARLRIHIKRTNKQLKENYEFDTPTPLTLTRSVNKLWTLAWLNG